MSTRGRWIPWGRQPGPRVEPNIPYWMWERVLISQRETFKPTTPYVTQRAIEERLRQEAERLRRELERFAPTVPPTLRVMLPPRIVERPLPPERMPPPTPPQAPQHVPVTPPPPPQPRVLPLQDVYRPGMPRPIRSLQ